MMIKWLPEFLRKSLVRIRNWFRRILYRGQTKFCPVCEKSSRKFLPFGRPRRQDARCPQCGALERHRLLWLYLKMRTDLFDGRSKKVLHIAPEQCFEPLLRKSLGDGYITADLYNPKAMVKMDITNIDYYKETFDVILCSHVLEHVDDDKKALREFWRVLKHNGRAFIMVPITAEVTFEDPTIVDPKKRFIVFGQEDHVRRYGHDFVDRLNLLDSM